MPTINVAEPAAHPDRQVLAETKVYAEAQSHVYPAITAGGTSTG
jgi:hypothetical protein